jgi:hypothetical protein
MVFRLSSISFNLNLLHSKNLSFYLEPFETKHGIWGRISLVTFCTEQFSITGDTAQAEKVNIRFVTGDFAGQSAPSN